jgi:hypothetical protein
MSEGHRVRQVVYGDDVELRSTLGCAKESPADPSKTVDADSFHGSPFSMNKPNSLISD